MNVLSLFDGISCGQVAFERLGIKFDGVKNKYYASEIDKYAIQITQKNYPNTIQLGDITEITENEISALGSIDIIIGGSPCQSLSNINVWESKKNYGINGNGKSRLFWEYVRILKIVQKTNPSVKFLLENVGSANLNSRQIIDCTLGVVGVKFNSNLMSAQNRNRIYWSNIEFKVPTERKNIFLQDVLEETVNEKYFLTQKMYNCVMCPASRGWTSGKMEIDLPIARPLIATMHKMHRADADNYVSCKIHPANKTNVRRLTPLECERLQTLPDDYTKIGSNNSVDNLISDTQRYITIGNGWTVDVIAHILSFM